MAQFLAEIHGCRGPASRLGSKQSGIRAKVGSWSGGVSVYMYHDDKEGRDMVRVSLCTWTNGAGVDHELYNGPCSGDQFRALKRLEGKK